MARLLGTAGPVSWRARTPESALSLTPTVRWRHCAAACDRSLPRFDCVYIQWASVKPVTQDGEPSVNWYRLLGQRHWEGFVAYWKAEQLLALATLTAGRHTGVTLDDVIE